MALEQKNVLIYTIVRMPERENLFKWVCAIAEPDSTYLYRLSERKDIAVNTLEDAKKYRIGVIRESMYHQFLAKNGFRENVNLQIVPSMEQNYYKLVKKRIDLWAEGEKNFQDEMIRQSSDNPNIHIEKTFLLFSYPYYMAFSTKTSNEIVEKVGAAFDQLVKEGMIKKNE
ncbi:MAG: hypothetical protein C0403_11135 [Desulfobacterium sp.]|nr:hypothetical protein [Desulfobacterium sp.]